MLGKPRRLLHSLNVSAPFNILVNIRQTHKDKRLPIDFFIPAHSVCLRFVSSFRPFFDQHRGRARPGAVIFT